jgi:uncharacterized protein YdeI (YjbR/CyaY-like superfamily)
MKGRSAQRRTIGSADAADGANLTLVDMSKRLFKNRAEWREWLSKHHATESGIWLVYYKKYCGKESIRYEKAVEEALY